MLMTTQIMAKMFLLPMFPSCDIIILCLIYCILIKHITVVL